MNTARIIAAGSLAVGFASFALATPIDIYVSGSTAYRTQCTDEEIVVASAGLTGAGYSAGTQPGEGYTSSSAFSVSNLEGSSVSVVHGYDAAGNEIIFHNHFTGSTAGLVDLCANNTTVGFISAGIPAVGSTAVGLSGSGITTAPEVVMSDEVYTDAAAVLASTGDNTTGKNAAVSIKTTNIPTEAGSHPYVGSVNFEWLAGALASGAPSPNSPINNLTQDNAEVLLTSGQLGANFVTGNTNDASSVIVFIGRNEDSGTRTLTQAESWANGTGNSFGLGASTVQYLVTQSGVLAPTSSGYSSLSADANGITGLQEWPQYNWNGSNYTTKAAGGWSLYTESSITWASLGHSGYNGGGDVAAILASPNPVVSASVSGIPTGFNQVYIVSCIGTHDASSALSASPAATALKYNGVTYSINAVESGQYPLWNFEHCYYLTGSQPNGLATVANGSIIETDANALANGLYNGTFGTSTTDVGIAGQYVALYPAMYNRAESAGSYSP